MTTDDPKQQDSDIEVEITNGKKIKIDLSPVEWIIFMSGVSVIAMITGVAL